MGNDWVVSLLQNHLTRGRIRHAYLFTGPQGIGKRTLALKLAQGINCELGSKTGTPCGTCRSCRLIAEMQHPDLTIVQSERVGGNLKVDQIREMQHSLALTPYEARYRVAMILRIEEANLNAANALLKTLEEPPSRVVLMLTSQDSDTLLPTIVSRCELFRLRSLPLDMLSEGLQNHFGVLAEESHLLSSISGGSPGIAIQIHRDPSIMEKRLELLEEHQRLLSAHRVERFAYAEALAKDKDKLTIALQIWSSFWRDVLFTVSGSSVPVTNLDKKKEIKYLADQVKISKVEEVLRNINQTRDLIDRYVNPRLTLEILMLNLPYV